jgi:hypothetical protein
MSALVLAANTLMDAQLAGPDGAEVIAVPARVVGELLAYPRPGVRRGETNQPVSLVLDLRRFLISAPGGLSVPMECFSAEAAVAAATALREAAERDAVRYSPAALANWAGWWCTQRSDAALLVGGEGQ